MKSIVKYIKDLWRRYKAVRRVERIREIRRRRLTIRFIEDWNEMHPESERDLIRSINREVEELDREICKRATRRWTMDPFSGEIFYD